MAQKYLTRCYEIQTAAILHFNHGDIAGAAKTCDGAPLDMRSTCYVSLGRDITSHALRDPDRSIAFCNLGTDSYRPWCYWGAVKALIDWSAASASGMDFCRRLGQVAGWLKCYEAVGEQIGALVAPQPEREKQCGQAGRPEAILACHYGARIPGGVAPAS